MTPNLQNRPYFGEVHFFGKNILFYVRQLKCLFPDSLIFITYIFFKPFLFILFYFLIFYLFVSHKHIKMIQKAQVSPGVWAFFLRGPALNNYIEIWHLTFHEIQHITTAEKSVKSMNL